MTECLSSAEKMTKGRSNNIVRQVDLVVEDVMHWFRNGSRECPEIALRRSTQTEWLLILEEPR